MSIVIEEPRFHPRYTYKFPEQVILVSNNGLHFAVFKEDLIVSSSAFSDAFNIPQPPPGAIINNHNHNHLEVALRKAIHIDANDLVTEWFIIILGSTLLVTPETDFESAVSLLVLCKKFQVDDTIVSLIEDRMRFMADMTPWTCLSIASKLNDRQMGASALLKMGQEGFFGIKNSESDPSTSTFWDRISTLSPSWVIPILSTALSLPLDTQFNPEDTAELVEGDLRTFESGTRCQKGDSTLKVLRATMNWDERCGKFRDGVI